jgi:sugar/nucleoside kinase (ribokinase family)
MKSKQPANESTEGALHKAPVKILSLQLAITERDLPEAVRQAFNLAKGSGRELDLAFNLPPEI